MFVDCGIWCLADVFERQPFVCSDEGLTLETSAKHHMPQSTNIPYQPLLIKPIFSVLARAEKQFFSKLVFQCLFFKQLSLIAEVAYILYTSLQHNSFACPNVSVSPLVFQGTKLQIRQYLVNSVASLYLFCPNLYDMQMCIVPYQLP